MMQLCHFSTATDVLQATDVIVSPRPSAAAAAAPTAKRPAPILESSITHPHFKVQRMPDMLTADAKIVSQQYAFSRALRVLTVPRLSEQVNDEITH